MVPVGRGEILLQPSQGLVSLFWVSKPFRPGSAWAEYEVGTRPPSSFCIRMKQLYCLSQARYLHGAQHPYCTQASG